MAHKLSSAAKKVVRARLRKLLKEAKSPSLTRAQVDSMLTEIALRERELKSAGGKKKRRAGSKGSKRRGGKKRSKR
jgi:hypothetical protein